ncbi:MAG: hypothetical protein Q8O76_10045, partial [Chloroflexota bacterium]|nr:hypothetical protein [Chloroflexota bacterium]
QAAANIDFSGQTVALADVVQGKAVFHRSSYPSGVGAARTLYVKKLAQHDSVRVVPGAKTLAEVYSGAPGSYVLTLASSNLLTLTADGAFWRVSGITGTGAMGETAPPPPPPEEPTYTPTPRRSLPDPAAWALMLSGLIFLSFYVLLTRWKARRRTQ